jgi:hypothetical protein
MNKKYNREFKGKVAIGAFKKEKMIHDRAH